MAKKFGGLIHCWPNGPQPKCWGDQSSPVPTVVAPMGLGVKKRYFIEYGLLLGITNHPAVDCSRISISSAPKTARLFNN